jgi:hypothetical protein
VFIIRTAAIRSIHEVVDEYRDRLIKKPTSEFTVMILKAYTVTDTGHYSYPCMLFSVWMWWSKKEFCNIIQDLAREVLDTELQEA